MSQKKYEEWFQHAEKDFNVANLLSNQSEFFNIALFHIQQSIEKYLKGYLIEKNWKLRKIHDLESLLNDAIGFDSDFNKFLDLGRKLTMFYIEERYPPIPSNSYSDAEIQEYLTESKQLIELIKLKVL